MKKKVKRNMSSSGIAKKNDARTWLVDDQEMLNQQDKKRNKGKNIDHRMRKGLQIILSQRQTTELTREKLERLRLTGILTARDVRDIAVNVRASKSATKLKLDRLHQANQNKAKAYTSSKVKTGFSLGMQANVSTKASLVENRRKMWLKLLQQKDLSLAETKRTLTKHRYIDNTNGLEEVPIQETDCNHNLMQSKHLKLLCLSALESVEAKEKGQIAPWKEIERERTREEQSHVSKQSRNPATFRCPVIAILGRTNVGTAPLAVRSKKSRFQEGDTVGISQQLSITYIEKGILQSQAKNHSASTEPEIQIPGIYVIDTQGKVFYRNFFSRGSLFCDMAILVIDLKHRLEAKNIENLNMLIKHNVPFVIALNDVDKSYSWKHPCKGTALRDALKKQTTSTPKDFRSRIQNTKVQLMELGVNSNLYWEMEDEDWENADFVPMVPILSSVPGEGIDDIMWIMCQLAKKKILKQIIWHDSLQCTVLEVKSVKGLGVIADVLVLNGYLKVGDNALFCTIDGATISPIRAILTLHQIQNMVVKSCHHYHKQVKGTSIVSIVGNKLDKVIVGTPVLIVRASAKENVNINDELPPKISDLMNNLHTERNGIQIKASSMGALETLLQYFRKECKLAIPIGAVGIGKVYKRDVTKVSIMNKTKSSGFALILAFGMKIEKDIHHYAANMGVRIFTAYTVQHLLEFIQFTNGIDVIRKQKAIELAVFPCIIKILPQYVFRRKDPIIVGCNVIKGILRLGTPLCIPSRGGIYIGKVASIQRNGNNIVKAQAGDSVGIKIVNDRCPNLTYGGRKFDATHCVYSELTRSSIEAVEMYFKEEMRPKDWKLMLELKFMFNIL